MSWLKNASDGTRELVPLAARVAKEIVVTKKAGPHIPDAVFKELAEQVQALPSSQSDAVAVHLLALGQKIKRQDPKAQTALGQVGALVMMIISAQKK